MADYLEFQGHEHTKATEEFIRKVDKFFDCLNGGHVWKAQTKLKKNLKPYYQAEIEKTDPEKNRLKVLKTFFFSQRRVNILTEFQVIYFYSTHLDFIDF